MKCVAPIHALSVPKGCSTVCRRRRDACGVRPRRFCIASSTCSFSQREIRRYSPLVHRALMGHFGQAEDQYLCSVKPGRPVALGSMPSNPSA